MSKCWLHLTNGWTVSISEDDTPPALCSVAAWPSVNDSLIVDLDKEDYFTFSHGQKDKRCWCLEDIRSAISEVEAASPANG